MNMQERIEQINHHNNNLPNQHPYRRVNGIKIDRNLVPLIRNLWRLEIKTSNCCQDNCGGWVWIQFMNSKEALKFLTPVHTILDDMEWNQDFNYDVNDPDMGNHRGRVSIRFRKEELRKVNKVFRDIVIGLW